VRRLVWTAIGAAGGIWAYRKTSELLDQAREQGVALTIQQIALSATQAANQVSGTVNKRAVRGNKPVGTGITEQPTTGSF
jgi:hypothetical protein